ncbi:MAG: hypothetical protein ACO2OS_02045 [Thermosphaera aggregans]|jgi:hypothetical protein|uniref:hypothetical protein n=1 Tax=Thermosphaera aggregans TaxID=54254 RepID=UPI003C04507F
MLLEDEEVFEAEEVEVKAEAGEEGEEKEVVEIKVELLKQMLNISKMWQRVLSGEASIDELKETAFSRTVLKAPRPTHKKREEVSIGKEKKSKTRKKRSSGKRKSRKTGK